MCKQTFSAFLFRWDFFIKFGEKKHGKITVGMMNEDT